MKIRQILDEKGSKVLAISPGATVMDALQLLVAEDVGSLVVLDDQAQVRGIITERDILRLTSRDPAALRRDSVEATMTTELIVAHSSDEVQRVMQTMTRKRIRHIPVVDQGALVGIISIGDVVNALRQEKEEENHHLREYVQGSVR
jgi:CBS domain-containing protein